uniref:Putative nuclease HARBI1 n=1 Tax=Lygus hesperus TaxID=30085 RepID=A0A146L3K0_LYGHE
MKEYNVCINTSFFCSVRHLLPVVFYNLFSIFPGLDFRGNPVSPEEKLLTALSFYASGSFMEVCGDRHGLSKSSVCVIVHQVSDAIARLAPQFISLPGCEEEKIETREKFHRIARFPGCVGALDCTHVKISSPGGDDAEMYRNRKGYFSLNVQTVSDADLKITNIVARWPGSSHDATVLRHSSLWRQLTTLGHDVILADSGYGLTKNLITKVRNPSTEAERRFNESQIRTRNVVERSYGVWKRRFPILANGIRVKLERTQAIIVATAVLHNIAILLNERLPEVDAETDIAVDQTMFNNIVEREEMGEEGGVDNRSRFVSYFGSLS